MIPVEYYIALSGILFLLGGAGFLLRRNMLVSLMCIEIMLNATNLALVAFNRTHTSNHSGQILTFFVIAVAAAEAAVGLAILLAFYRVKRTLRTDEADLLRN
jgi:NADH-quinone oxidoreductase subunit K